MSKLYTHTRHEHTPRKVSLKDAEATLAGFNMKIAVAITRALGTMWMAYLFAALAIVGFPGFSATLPQYIQWLSQTFIQLTALSVLAVGQQVLGHQQELQADEQFATTQKSYHDITEIMAHLAAQDEELLKHTAALKVLLDRVTESATLTTGTVASMEPVRARGKPRKEGTDR